MIIRCVLQERIVRIHASEDGIAGSRNYLHARTYSDACRWLIERGGVAHFDASTDRPDRWNIPGQKRLSNLEFAQRVAAIIGLPLKYEIADGNISRPGHDLHYGLDGTKITEAGWTPPLDFDAALERTVRWYLRNHTWLELS
jgi:dTDP-D-glucose 4,6-dehydratase